MASEIYNSLDLQKASRLDSRLDSVSTYANLPDLTDASLFLFEGATIYVSDEKVDYQAQFTVASPTVLQWIKLSDVSLVTGAINILPSTVNIDLSLVVPAIETCDKVIITVVGGSSATITSITNWPTGKKLTFFSSVAQSITYKHTDYDVAGLGDMVIEDGRDMTLTGRVIGNESLTFEENGSSFVQWDATQFIKTSELAQNLLNIAVTDNLTTTSTSSALSANQGVVLSGLINTKQNTITAGDNLSFSGSTLNAAPWPWTVTTVNSLPLGTTQDNYLTTTWGTTTQKYYRLVDFTSTGDKFMLPVGLNPSIISNWILIQSNEGIQKHSSYPATTAVAPQSDLIGGFWHPRFLLTGLVGDPSGLTWVTGVGGSNFGFSFAQTGLYKVKFKLNMIDDGSVPTRTFLHELHITDSVGLSTDPTSTSIGVVDQYITSPFSEAAISKNVIVTLEKMINVTTVGSSNGFVVKTTSSTGDFTGYTLNPSVNGFLEIVKIR